MVTERRQRRLIYNHDGMEAIGRRYRELTAEGKGKLAPEKPVIEAVEQIAGTQVDTLCWCIGTANSTVWYDSRVADIVAASNDNITEVPCLRELIRKGSCPLALAVKIGHEADLEVFASLRMNDGHHWRSPEGPLSGKLWREHPEYRLKHMEGKGGGPLVSWDYAIPDVRQHILDIIHDVASRYDIDGFELGFSRSAFVFSGGETKRNAGILTDFIETVRENLDSVGRSKNGKPILLSAHVPKSPLIAAELGLDVAEWMKRELLEYIAFGETDLNLPVGQWKKLAEGTHCGVYPCIGADADQIRGVKMSPDTYRAWALNFHMENPDGIYIFNMPCFSVKELDAVKETLLEIGTEGTIALDKPRHYAYYLFPDVPGTRRETSEDMMYRHYYFAHESQMPKWDENSGGTRQEVLFKIADDIDRKEGLTGELSFKLLNVTEEDRVSIRINDRDIETDRISVKNVPSGNEPGFGCVNFEPYYKYTMQVDNQIIRKGDNKISVLVNFRSAGLKRPVRMEHLEIWVKKDCRK